MCHIFRCFGWILDIIQRFITCLLASVICLVICLGCVIAAGAGIAYGYNVSLAEYLDLKKSDITVYVRRGQFAGKAEGGVDGDMRRSNDDNDLFSSNFAADYQDSKKADVGRSLSDAWKQAQETRNYADKLTKYSKIKSRSKDGEDFFDEMASEESNSPDYEKPVELQPERPTLAPKPQNYNRDPPAPYNDLDDPKIYSKLDAEGQRPIQPIRTPKRKKPDIRNDVGHEAINLNLNSSKYLHNQEDFDDEEEKDFIQKPL